MVKRAWAKASNTTVRNCWRKDFAAEELKEDETVDVPHLAVGLNAEEFKKWVSVDNGVDVVEELSEEQLTAELVSKISKKEKVTDVSDEEDCEKDHEPVEESERATTSAAEMRECLRRLATGLEPTGFKEIDLFNSKQN